MAQAQVSDKSPTRDTVTDWGVFTQLRLNPRKLRCNSYSEVHGSDSSCHTTLKPTLDSIKSHINAGHSGAFYLELTQVPEGAKVWTGWQDLKALGAEIEDLRSAGRMHTKIDVNAPSVRQYMAPHVGHDKKMQEGGKFYITISFPKYNAPTPVDEE